MPAYANFFFQRSSGLLHFFSFFFLLLLAVFSTFTQRSYRQEIAVRGGTYTQETTYLSRC